MKKILFVLSLSVLFFGCSKDKDSTTPEQVDIDELTSLVNKSVSEVKTILKSYELLEEKTTLGKTTLLYEVVAKEATVGVSIEFNEGNIAKDINVVTKEYLDYSDMINLSKIWSDRVNIRYNTCPYVAYWYIQYSFPDVYSKRNDFWVYVSNNKVSNLIAEFWTIDAQINEKIIVRFSGSKNVAQIEIVTD
jgi:hypothetical protein